MEERVSLEVLPNDILWMIFHKCPIETHFALMSVSERCNFLLSDQQFRTTFLARNKGLFYMNCSSSSSSVYNFNATEMAVGDCIKPFPHPMYFAGCHMGLVCLLDMAMGDYILWNPHAPKEPPIQVQWRGPMLLNFEEFSEFALLRHGLCYDHKDNTFKLIVFSTSRRKGAKSFPFYLINFNRGTVSIRHQSGLPPRNITQSDAAVLNGTPYWPSSSPGERVAATKRARERRLLKPQIFYFDHVNEEIKSMQLPGDESFGLVQGLSSVDGRLLLASLKDDIFTIDIYCLLNYHDPQSWIRQYSLTCDPPLPFINYKACSEMRSIGSFRPVDIVEDRLIGTKGGCVVKSGAENGILQVIFMENENNLHNRLISCGASSLFPQELRALQVQDMESDRYPQPKMASRTESAASKGKHVPPAPVKEISKLEETANEERSAGPSQPIQQTSEKLKTPEVPEEVPQKLAAAEGIRDHIMSKSICVSGFREILADDLLPNKTVRDTIDRILESNNDTGDDAGSSLQVQGNA